MDEAFEGSGRSTRHPGADERDACGTGFVAHREGERSHRILRDALGAVQNLEHRGAVSPDGRTSDGAGVLTQLPLELFDTLYDEVDPDRLAVGVFFLSRDPDVRRRCRSIADEEVERAGLEVVRWREVPFETSVLGEKAPGRPPAVRQLLVHRPSEIDTAAFGRHLYLARRRIEKRVGDLASVEPGSFAIPSFSHRTIVYKGLVVPELLPLLYPDLDDRRYKTGIGVFHQRYSTNTMPTWARAQPLRFVAHNGEINTLLGNINAMRAREPVLESDLWGENLDELTPVIDEDGSDSMALDAVLELLVRSGRDPVHAMAMLVPEAFEAHADVDPDWRAFSRYHAAAMEPWDGPAALVFSDGRLAGAKLDRNGLRPLRYWVTEDRVVVGSETGIVEADERSIEQKGRLAPGEMFVVDTETGTIRDNEQVREELAARRPWREWVDENATFARSVEAADAPSLFDEKLERVQQAYGFGREHLTKLLDPMVFEESEAVGSMGDDTPLAVLSEEPQRICRYFRQRFAQVTNPPIDSLRERSVMSLRTRLVLGGTLLEQSEDGARFIEFDSPVMTSGELAWLEWSAGCIPSPPLESGEAEPPPAYKRLEGRVTRLDTRFAVADGPEGMVEALDDLRASAEDAVRNGARVLILSDREVDEDHAAIPSLLATAAVHHHLIRNRLRLRTGIVCDAGDVLGEHDYATLLGYGAMSIHPRVAYESVANLAEGTRDRDSIPLKRAQQRYRKTVEKGILKIMAKLGISDVESYRGAQTFEILGIADDVVEEFFEGTPSRVDGADLHDLAEDVLRFHGEAFGGDPRLEELGLYRYRRGGEFHAFNPRVFKKLHAAVREEDFDTFREYADQVDERPPCTLRDLLRWDDSRPSIDLDEVEPAESIVERFTTQAMSFGSLSREMHETLAVAMNRLGAKSNSGEGGEEHARFERYEEDRPDRSVADWHPKAGDSGSSAIKQIASGRFGVTPRYLASAEQFEIKMAQGSKPGEGGQIPGHKVTEAIAETRNATPGVPLISPPPHHDIYSIEDLAQLIYDLKRVNERASVAVKLVSLVGVGTIAAGVAKAYADTIQISGHDGGTGASPLGSIKHAGLPWELGLSDTHRTLAAESLREQVRLRVDGGLKTGRDVAIAAMLGADEFGFGTAPLVAAGCVMARQCHLNTCPVGVATQDPELRERFPGTPDRVIAFMCFVAEHLRHILADLGLRSVEELVGRRDLLELRPDLPERAERLDLSYVLESASTEPEAREDPAAQTSPPAIRTTRNERPESQTPLDQRIVEAVGDPRRVDEPIDLEFSIDNRQRTVGARLGGEIARHGVELDDGTIQLVFKGQAGQSFGAFCNDGMRLVLEGEAQDYVGKGMGGGQIVIRPPEHSRLVPHENAIMGNTCLYGATGGRFYASGVAGERLAIRNSGAIAVVEGCGDHGCEYMTGGVVVVLGETGLNFGAGMSGGQAFVYDETETLQPRLNRSRVEASRLENEEAEKLRRLVEDFAAQTGSERARSLLENWNEDRAKFRRVAPEDASQAQQRSVDFGL